MRQYTDVRTYYTKADCDALDQMSKAEAADILENLEGTWMPGRPGAYYSLQAGAVEETEMDFDLLRAIKAVDLAAKWLRRAAAAEKEAG